MKTLPGRAILAVVVATTVGARAAHATDDLDAPAVAPGDVAASPEHPPAGPLPEVHWLTLDTPHFHIHYYADERPYAEHAAIIAERAYRLNTRYLNWLPSGRVSLTLEDQTDSADGYAS